MDMVAVSSWGRLGLWEHEVVALADRAQVKEQIRGSRPSIAFGMGRSYGDVCLNPDGLLWNTSGLNRFIRFDQTTGRLHCEAGVLLRDIQRMMIPRGWRLPVTPGTQIVTVGGAIANDVHGKNHHVAGSFGDHLRWIKLVRTDGSIIECGPHLLSAWFAATVGGLGLTGVIVEVELQLAPSLGPWLETETIAYNDLTQFFQLSDDSDARWEHTVSWIDCLAGSGGRGLFMRANSVDAAQRPLPSDRQQTMPFVPPVSLVNRLTLRPFNNAYYYLKKAQAGNSIMHYESFLSTR